MARDPMDSSRRMAAPAPKADNPQQFSNRNHGPTYSIMDAKQWARVNAANDIPLETVVSDLRDAGYPATGKTIRRVTDAYNEQKARG